MGEEIRRRRERLKLKVYELARKVDVDPVYITQIELHNKLPSPSVFIKILLALELEGKDARDLYDQYKEEKFPEFVALEKEFYETFELPSDFEDRDR